MSATEPVQRRWRGVEPETRRQQRRTRLLEAAFDLAGTEGSSAATVRAICARTGLHSRYFYESFPDLDALMGALFEELASQGLAEIAAATSEVGNDPRAWLSSGLRAAARFLTEDPRRMRIMAIDAVENSALTQRRLSALHAFAALAEQALYANGPSAPGEPIGRISVHLISGGLADLLIAWLDKQIDATLDEMIDDTVELIMAVFDRASALAAARAPA